MYISYRHGFSLLELSIVLVVIGLIVGGVTVGRDLIRSAELQTTISEVSKFAEAFEAFEYKYQTAPGDLPDAESLWGSVSGDCLTDAGNGTETCNGDGDGLIDAVYAMYDADVLHESWRAWEHLVNAELLQGDYTGVSATGCSTANWCAVAGVNIPSSNVSAGAGWSVMDVQFGSGFYWEGKSETRRILILGNPNNPGGDGQDGVFYGMVFTPADLYSLDNKVDDGRPNAGRLVNMNGGGGTWEGTTNPDCTIGSTLPTPTPDSMAYNLSYNSIACTLIIDLE